MVSSYLAGVPASGNVPAGSAQTGSAGGSAQAQDGGSPWNLLAAMLTLPESYISGGSEVASLAGAFLKRPVNASLKT